MEIGIILSILSLMIATLAPLLTSNYKLVGLICIISMVTFIFIGAVIEIFDVLINTEEEDL